METIDQAYIGLDLHANNSVFSAIDLAGKQRKGSRLPTQPARLQSWLKRLPAANKQLAIEEGPLTQWISWQLRGYVDKLVVCDPKQNFLISHSARKADGVDALKLARLLRLEELSPVWHPEQKGRRALFAAAARHYVAMRKHQVRLKLQLKALFRRWGVLDIEGETLYSKQGRQQYLQQVVEGQIRRQLRSYYSIMDKAVTAQDEAEKHLYRAGKAFPEISEFQKMPGVGTVGSHLFDGFVATPHRFTSASKLWSWSGLAVTDRSSDGKPLGHERLDPNGRSEIKDISYRAWKAGAMAAKEDNELKCFYKASLERTGNPTRARLNTQRKILKVLWTIWRKDIVYDPQQF
jgi:hypothetical protein